MQSVFLNRKGDVIFTYPDIAINLRQSDRVKFNGKIYYVVQRTFNVQGGFFEILLHESDETE